MKIIPALTGPMSGKLGGMVASRNRGGQYFRRKAVPVNPDTTRQVAVRSNFATLISYWNNLLTQAERESWIQWAANTPRIDSLGQTHILTGQNAFVGYNSLRLQAGLAVVEENTGVYNRGEAAAIESAQFVNVPPAALLITLAYSSVPSANGNALIYIGRPQNQSVNFYKGPYRFTQAVSITAGTPISINDIVESLWPYPIPENIKLPMRVVTTYVDGRYTDGFDTLVELGTIPTP